MKITHDKALNGWYIDLTDNIAKGGVAYTSKMAKGIRFDYNENHAVIGIEILEQ